MIQQLIHDLPGILLAAVVVWLVFKYTDIGGKE